VLEGLAAIDWSATSHAYGPATDVPDMIRELDSLDAAVRDQAFYRAFGNIFHQGTRYPATPIALPFVIELAAQPEPKALVQLLDLIVHCVAGYFTPTSGPGTPMIDYGETVELLAQIELAAEPAVPMCGKLLGHADPAVRQRAAWVLAALRRFADRYEIVPRLETAFAGERDPSVRALIAFALGHLGRARRLVEIFDGDRDDLVRAIAMTSCASCGETTPAMLDALLGWLDAAELHDAYAELCFGSPLSDALSAALPRFGTAALERAMPKLLAQLSTDVTFAVVGILDAALAATFTGPAPKDATQLTAMQRELLVTIVANQGFWMIGNAFSLLAARALPADRDEMAAYIGVPVVVDRVAQAKQIAEFSAVFGHDEALAKWRDVLALAPDDLDALRAMGRGLVELGRDDEATPFIEQIPADDPTGAFLRGSLAFNAGDLESALAFFTTADASTDKTVVELAHQNRIAILQRLGRAGEALELELAKGDASTPADWYHRGLAQVKAGDYAGCIASIQKSLEGRPVHANGHYTLACAYALSGQVDAALASIAKALEIEPALAGDIAADTDFASIAGDPRFAKLVS
jgi:tetratricopeptide (TPR) repeat protein